MSRSLSLSRLAVIPCLALALGLAAGFAGAEPEKKDNPPLRQATFELRNEVKIKVPAGTHRLRAWLALPQDNDPAQQVRDLKIEAPYPYRITQDSEGSRVLYLEVQDPKEQEIAVVETFGLTRSEIRDHVDAGKAGPLTAGDRERFAKYLEANKYVVIDDEIRKLADQIVGNETNPVRMARKLYDWVLENVDYWVKDPKNKKASPVGSTTYCLQFRTGNCTDFESLWASLARAKGIPTQIVYGSFLKPDLRAQDQDQSYHCWAEFYAPGLGWVHHDVAVADLYEGDYPITAENERLVRLTASDGTFGKDPAKVDYYFGNLDERRVVWSRNRDLTMSPKQDGEPVNALPKAYVEVDGKVLPEGSGWTRKLTYREP
ncbi:MAG TPA: transglutaminase domain-containing protein [Candidatus Sulfotelmatobacter sp.]|nr:transglutaminase domain-containing protein [Candidatus Sulfotelmatobacter sp.]